MIFNTSKKYILGSFSKILVEVTLLSFALCLITNLVQEITFFKESNVSGFYPVFLAFLNAPSIVMDLLPFIF